MTPAQLPSHRLDLDSFTRLGGSARRAVATAARRYTTFLGPAGDAR